MPKNKKCQFKSNLVEHYTCPEPVIKGSDCCIFHKPNKTEEEAELFQKKIKEKLQNKDYVFIGFYFPKETSFDRKVFPKSTDFTESTFERDAYFRESTFKGFADFQKSTFERGAYFRESTFEGSADFQKSTFEEYADFQKSTFDGSADFRESTFEEYADFEKSTFWGGADFRESTFEGSAYFRELTFWGGADFRESTFEEYADFRESTFGGYARFTGSIFARIPGFEGVTFRDKASAEEAFRIAKTCSQREGDYSLAGEYYYKERIARRKQLPWYSRKRWFEYMLLDGICGYGERPLRTIRTGLGVLLGLAFLYWRVDHIFPSPELFNEPHTLTFLDALYFSVVTFTTLGFGDWRPDPSHWIRYIVMSEAFIGAFLMALFIVTFARRMMR